MADPSPMSSGEASVVGSSTPLELAPEPAATEDADPQERSGEEIVSVSSVNVGWIGGPCKSAQDCAYENSICLLDGYPNGMCSLPCDLVCPDRRQPGTTMTFCADGRPLGADRGLCLPRCDVESFGPDGCAPGYSCSERHRAGDPNNVASVCLPTRARPCGSDELIPLDYPDKGSIWIPAEAHCSGAFDLVVMMHGTNRRAVPAPLMGGGLHLEVLTRALIDGGLMSPILLAEPVHFEATSDQLYGEGYQLTHHLDMIRQVLDARGISLRSISFTGHSGAGCHENNGLYKVLDNLGAIIPTYAPALKLWGLQDVCYEAPYHWEQPLLALGHRDTRVVNMYSAQGDPSEFEANLFPEGQSFACSSPTYHHCYKSPVHPWCSMRTLDTTHEINPYVFTREVFPQVFPGPASGPPCWRQ